VLALARERGLDVAAIPSERLLRNWRLVRDTNGEARLTLAGTLFLARAPATHAPMAYVSAISIRGRDISINPVDQKRLDGRLMDVFQATMQFFYLHLKQGHEIRGHEPEIKPELPPEALREAVVNALAHRDYTVSSPVRVIVFEDRVEVRTPGRLPNTVTVDALRSGIHVVRNPAIYNIFLKIGLVTDAGSGIPRMIRLVREATGHEPEFRIEGNEFVVMMPRSSG